jgi:hypothetical protein
MGAGRSIDESCRRQAAGYRQPCGRRGDLNRPLEGRRAAQGSEFLTPLCGNARQRSGLQCRRYEREKPRAIEADRGECRGFPTGTPDVGSPHGPQRGEGSGSSKKNLKQSLTSGIRQLHSRPAWGFLAQRPAPSGMHHSMVESGFFGRAWGARRRTSRRHRDRCLTTTTRKPVPFSRSWSQEE